MALSARLPAWRPAITFWNPRILLLAGLTGVVTGAGVAGFEWVTNQQLFERLVEAPLWVQVLAPATGLGLAAGALVVVGGRASPATSDEYIKAFHERTRPLDLRPFWGRLLAGVATLGSGGALGYEGPSLYLGATVGSAVQRRWARWFGHRDTRLLLVAGAAAGVAAIFKAPATGAIFALEVPYRDDNARRMLLPALLASATGYLTFVALLGTQPLFSVGGTPPFDLRELGGAVALGLLCGGGARLYARVLGWGKGAAARFPSTARVPACGVVLAGLALVSHRLFDETLSLGPGYRALQWVTDPGHSLWLVLALFAVRLAATTATVAGGGVGGLFVPLVIAGAITGNALAVVLQDHSTLFPLIGMAAFLSAGYRTPLAGVMFVAETTGRPGFVVPGLIAAVASQLVMGDVSVSPYQVSGRLGFLERRLGLTVSAVVDGQAATVPASTSLWDFFHGHLAVHHQAEVAVVDDDGTYRGVARLYDLRHVPVGDWRDRSVADLADPAWPRVAPTATVEDAVRAMDHHGVHALAVVNEHHQFTGLATTASIVALDQVMDQLGPTAPP